MKTFIIYFLGILFGITLSQGQVVSWYRIQEMFRFDSFHMYGIIGSAILLGMLSTFFIKKGYIKSIYGDTLLIPQKDKSVSRYLIGGTLFGLGWALAGACPGPMFILLGQGWLSMILVVLSAMIGTWIYGITKHKLPH